MKVPSLLICINDLCKHSRLLLAVDECSETLTTDHCHTKYSQNPQNIVFRDTSHKLVLLETTSSIESYKFQFVELGSYFCNSMHRFVSGTD